MKKNSREQWIALFEENNPDKNYDYSLLPQSFIGNDMITIICPINGKFSIKAANLRRGKGNHKNSYTNEEFLKECNKIHNNYYNYTEVIFNEKLMKNIICPIHGYFNQNKYSHKNGNGCKKCCNKKPKKEIKDYLNLFKKIHNQKYDYSKSIFNGVWKNIEIICPIHGSFFQSVGNHKLGSGCPKCSEELFKEQPRNQKTEEEIIHGFKLTHGNKYDYSKVNYVHNKEVVEIICKIHGSFFQNPNAHQQGNGCYKCSKMGYSKAEIEINNLFGDIFEQRNRELIKPLEIDLLNKEYKFGIEYNGVMFHSFGKHNLKMFNNLEYLDKNKHLKKTIAMEEKGYQLFHIKDLDWNNPIKKEIWYSIINSKLNKTIKIFARKTKVVDLTNHKEFVKEYLRNNHLQGNIGYLVAYGLEYNGAIYGIMTFGKPRLTKGIQWELLRFCNFKNHTIVGGASKLLKHFERIHKPESIISYANRDWSQGNLYRKLNFNLINISPPNYFYYHENGKVVSRYQAQKHKLEKLLDNFNQNDTELTNMINNNYRIYHDSGNLVYIKKEKYNGNNGLLSK